MNRSDSRRNIAGHSPHEELVGFSRAVVTGREIRVAGTAPIPRDGDPPKDAYGQAKLCLEIIGGALHEAGASFDDVVRTRLFLVDVQDYDDVARAHGEVFSAIRPASTAVVVKALLDPRWRVEVEADAILS